MSLNGLLQQSLALMIALIYGTAAVSKVMAWQELPGVVGNFRILPAALVPAFSVALPIIEALIAAALLIDATRHIAACAAALLFMIFAAALAVNLRRGRLQIDCGCFRSDLKQPISLALVLRNLLLAVCALLVAAPGTAVPLSALEWTLAAGAALSLFLCYLSIGTVFQRNGAAPPAASAAGHRP